METKPIIKDFIELVKINVQSKNERAIADALKEKLCQLGCEVVEDDAGSKIGGNTGNVIARLIGDPQIPAIMLSSHMDRVKGGDNINPIFHEETITSDGTTILAADDVAGLVVILDGIRRIKQEGIKHGTVEVVFTVCEEQGLKGSKFLDYQPLTAKMAYVFDSPGRIGRIVNEGPAKCRIIAGIYGKSAHAGNEPEKGLSAIKVAGTIMAEIKEGRINKNTTSNFGIIRGGEATNIVCDFVELTGEARSTKQEELDSYLEYVKKTFSEIATRFGARLELKVESDYDAMYVSEDEQAARILARAMDAVGVKYHFSAGGGGMDANRYNKEGIKSLGVSSGYSRNHTVNEEIYINDLIKAGELAKQIIQEAAKER